ncbi:hypothetical protein [Geomonas ferrireducens]|uniref:hypothetical protein n=1 Tax=Geomonas ferrireducens TaxID=2570227 RepID=UPI0010A7B71B|nr:hypothetical protein [Geomonas ferrireducens]
MIRSIINSLCMGCGCSLVGLLCGLVVSSYAIGNGWSDFWVYAAVTAFLTGYAAWWLLIEKRPHLFLEVEGKLRSGVFVGAIAGFVGHYICWYVIILSRNICYWFTGGCLSSLGDPPINPIYAIVGALPLTLWSLLFFGIITVPAGAIVGAVVAKITIKE